MSNAQHRLIEESELSDEQKRRLRALRRQYRASDVQIKNSGWELEVTYLDGSKVTINAKQLKLRAPELALDD